MSDLRKAAERALEALETLWDILDDIDTTSDIAKENDAWYRKRVEFLQKKRWDTTITTDGYKLKGGAVEALRQALAQPEQECIYPECETGIGCDGPCGEKPVDTVKQEPAVYKCPRCATSMDVDLNAKPVDAVNTSQERVDETAKRRHEPVAFGFQNTAITESNRWMMLRETIPADDQYQGSLWTPLYTAPPKREWVGLTAEEVWECYKENGNKLFYLAIEAKLKEKNGG